MPTLERERSIGNILDLCWNDKGERARFIARSPHSLLSVVIVQADHQGWMRRERTPTVVVDREAEADRSEPVQDTDPVPDMPAHTDSMVAQEACMELAAAHRVWPEPEAYMELAAVHRDLVPACPADRASRPQR